MIKAGRWLRVSTNAQDEASQEPDIDRWVTLHDYEAVETYRAHGESAYHGEHEPELRKAMADMAAKRIDVLVAWKSDRLERRGAYALMGLIAEAAKSGGRIEFVTEPALNNASDPIAGPMLQAFYGAMGHHESKVKSDRTSLGQAAARAAGSFFAGDIPYGHDSVTLDDGRKTLRPNGDAPVVARIFEELAGGATYYQVARGLTTDGIPTPRRKAAWSESAIGGIIANAVHRGLVQYKGVTYMTVEPITTASNWLQANALAKARARGRGHGTKGRPSGSLLRPRCGGCSGPMYHYGVSYRCAGVGPSGTSAQRKGCGNTISLETLDAEILYAFLAEDEPEIISTVIPGRDWAEEIAAVQLAIKDLADDEDYDERHAGLRAELKRLRALPVEAPRTTSARTGRTEGDAFASMTDSERRTFVRLWTLTVWPKDSEHQNALVARLAGRRWTLSRKS